MLNARVSIVNKSVESNLKKLWVDLVKFTILPQYIFEPVGEIKILDMRIYEFLDNSEPE